MFIGELAISKEKGRVARHRLVKELHGIKSVLSPAQRGEVSVDEFFGSEVKVVSSQVRSRTLADRTFFRWRELGLKLVGDFLGNLALNGEDIGQVAVIFFGPYMRVIAGID